MPWEQKIKEAREQKGEKYAELVEECRNRGRWARCLTTEVEGRGFAGKSLCKAYCLLGIKVVRKRRPISAAGCRLQRELLNDCGSSG